MEFGKYSKPNRFALLALPFLILVLTSGWVNPARAWTQASGSFQDTSVIGSQTRFSGGNEVIDQANAGVITGTFSGTYLTAVQVTVYPTGFATYTAIDTCTCTVSGQSGTLVFYEQGTLTPVNGVWQLSSTAKIIRSTGHLANLEALITLQGIVYTASGLTMGTYSGNLSFS